MSILYASGILILVLSWLQPMHIPLWVSWHSELLAFISAFLMAAYVLIASRLTRQHSIPVPRATIALFTLLALLAFQFSIGLIGFAGDFVVVALYLATGAVSIATGFNVSVGALANSQRAAHTQSHAILFAKAVLFAATCSVAIALVQALDVWDGVSWVNRTSNQRRPGANLSQPNQLATLTIMGIASLAYLYESRKLGSTVAAILFGILIFGVAVTESRSGMVSCLLMATWWFARRHTSGFKTPALTTIAGVALLFLLYWSWPTLLQYFKAGGQVADSASVGVDLSGGMRLIVWPQLIEAALQRPLLGWGLREISTAHNAVLHAHATGDPFTYAHNIVLDLLVGIGLPLTLIYCSLVAIWLFRRIRSATTLLPWYCIALILPIFVHSMFEFPFTYAYFWIPALFVIGLLEGVVEPTKAFRVKWWPAAIVVSLITPIAAWSVVEYIALEEDFRVVRFEVLKLGRRPIGYEPPTTYLLTQLAALNEVSRIAPAPGMSAERIELMHRVAMRFPWYATQNRYALALALNGNPGEATRQLKVMRAMHGEKSYRALRASWIEMAETKYPQLKEMPLP